MSELDTSNAQQRVYERNTELLRHSLLYGSLEALLIALEATAGSFIVATLFPYSSRATKLVLSVAVFAVWFWWRGQRICHAQWCWTASNAAMRVFAVWCVGCVVSGALAALLFDSNSAVGLRNVMIGRNISWPIVLDRVIIGPLKEELVFRVVVLPVLWRRGSKKTHRDRIIWCSVIDGMLFASFHLPNAFSGSASLTYVALQMLFGALSGTFYSMYLLSRAQKPQDDAPPQPLCLPFAYVCAMHIVNNAVAVLFPIQSFSFSDPLTLFAAASTALNFSVCLWLLLQTGVIDQ